MNRLVLTACLACSVAACGDNGDNNNNNNNNNAQVTITLFVAAPDTIDAGNSTLLVFAVAPPGTSANISGVGDVTGKTQIMVTPTATTTYQLTATDGKTTANSSATVTVKPVAPPPPPPAVGLVYTNPSTGRIRLVANTAQSTAQVIQLDLVANERLEVSSFFGGGPGSFAAGMNLPLDTTRVDADTTLFTVGNALNTGPVATPIIPVSIGRLGADHVLYTAVSRKRVAGDNFNQENEVQAGQVFYSVRLKLSSTATAGPVFDGAQPSPLFRAAVRDQYGDDFVNQGDFGIGKLEVR